jgi:hypothetical protein
LLMVDRHRGNCVVKFALTQPIRSAKNAKHTSVASAFRRTSVAKGIYEWAA